MGGQGVPGQKSVNITPINQPGKGLTGIIVENDRRPKDPEDEALLPVIFEQFIKFIVIDGKGGFPGYPFSKGEFFRVVLGKTKAAGMHKNTLFSVFPPAQGNPVSFL